MSQIYINGQPVENLVLAGGLNLGQTDQFGNATLSDQGAGGVRTGTGLAVSTTQGIQITVGSQTFTLAVLTTNP